MIYISSRGLAFYLVVMAIVLALAALFHVNSWLVAALLLAAIIVAIGISYRRK